ncbi:hypothetical protein BD414DRAFT_502011 [Trametes punicea]|nr:hypothetical protein BD414DRAFT_502011 [Trametes punicea]
MLDVQTAKWGWTGLIPGFGLLADEAPRHALRIWMLHYDEKAVSELASPDEAEYGPYVV